MKNKGILLAAFFAVAAFVGGAVGYNQYVVTRFGDLRCTDILLDGNDILDANGTTRITVGATNAIVGALTVSGAFTPSGLTTLGSVVASSITVQGAFQLGLSTAPRDSFAGVTPAIGQLIYNTTDREVCYATSTNKWSWVQLSTGPTSACAH